jgi:hypothetical protein
MLGWLKDFGPGRYTQEDLHMTDQRGMSFEEMS